MARPAGWISSPACSTEPNPLAQLFHRFLPQTIPCNARVPIIPCFFISRQYLQVSMCIHVHYMHSFYFGFLISYKHNEFCHFNHASCPLLLIFILHVVCLRVWAHICHKARVDALGKLVESALSFHCVAPRDGTQAW